MDPQPDLIRQQIDQTRSSLTDKLETLEAEVKGTVQSARETVECAKETVQETISSVKESVNSAKETVKHTFDIPYQVDRHPWFMLGLSLASGAVAGALLASRMDGGRRVARPLAGSSAEPPVPVGISEPDYRRGPTANGAGGAGFMEKLTGRFGNEFEKVKDLAIETLVGVAGEAARKAIPALARAVEDMLVRAAAEAETRPGQYGPQDRERPAGSGYQAPPMY
jgi:ElaB/YqjD/DUF883 family membrane-anchored ribosome-binding protein